MRRWLLNILAGLSLLLFIAAVGLWMRSIWCVDVMSRTSRPNYTVQVTSDPGRLGCVFWLGQTAPMEIVNAGGWNTFAAYEVTRDPRDPGWAYLGFNIVTTGPDLGFAVPDWFICVVTALPVYFWLRSYRRRHIRRLKGLCPKCGYDLRESRDRCPECGTPVMPAKA